MDKYLHAESAIVQATKLPLVKTLYALTATVLDTKPLTVSTRCTAASAKTANIWPDPALFHSIEKKYQRLINTRYILLTKITKVMKAKPTNTIWMIMETFMMTTKTMPVKALNTMKRSQWTNNQPIKTTHAMSTKLFQNIRHLNHKIHEFFIPADGIILGGDFNCYDNELDKFGCNASIAKYLSDFRSTFGFVDIWLKLHPKIREMTWFNSNFSLGSRLDKFYISRNLTEYAKSCEISPCCHSDHDLVMLIFDFSTLIPRGTGLWKFNNLLLNDEKFCSFLSD